MEARSVNNDGHFWLVAGIDGFSLATASLAISDRLG